MDYEELEIVQHVTLCAQCGGELPPQKFGRKRRFCTEQCRRAYWTVHADEMKVDKYICMCSYCGNLFPDKDIDKKYCSRRCYTRSRFYREEDTEALARTIREGQQVECLPGWIYELVADTVLKRDALKKQVKDMNKKLIAEIEK